MSLESLNEESVEMINNKDMRQVGQAITSLLILASEEKRITCGLKPAINLLEKNPDEVMFCVMPHTRDPACHIQSVLLQAFCYEHNITIIKVDSIDRLRKTVGAKDCSCILVHRNIRDILCLELEVERIVRSIEAAFVTPPVFKLPAK